MTRNVCPTPRKRWSRDEPHQRLRRGLNHSPANRVYDFCVSILAAVDDFLFRSKIRAVAKHVGVDVTFAQTPADILTQARELRPALAIFDLNSVKADPVATIAALKADASLAGIRAIGFASHVHTDLIAAAREAGADEVMPRSAFAGHLADILRSGAAGASR
jgi:DNA-binding NarL/FixJ family response regulator